MLGTRKKYICFFLLLSLALHSQAPSAAMKDLSWLWLCIALILMAAAIYFFTRYRRLEQQKRDLSRRNLELEIALEVSRSAVDPHFIFNSFSALQNFILNHEHLKANDYLVKFSKLTRGMLEGNISNRISVEQEITFIKSFLELKNIGFEGKLQFTVEADAAIVSETYIPVMMVQPFVENALWHGLQNKQGDKMLRVAFSLPGPGHIECIIEDNGLGRKKEEQLQHKKKISGILFVMQRLEFLNNTLRTGGRVTIEDKPAGQGTRVKVLLPILKKTT